MAVKKAAKKVARAGGAEAERAEESAAIPAVKAGKRILLVDDDAEIVESMRTVLESRGYQILVARDGNQGLVVAEGEEPDLVVLDMMMPKRSGFLVLEKLRRSRPNPMRVIMITANEEAVTRHTPRCSVLTTTSASRSQWIGCWRASIGSCPDVGETGHHASTRWHHRGGRHLFRWAVGHGGGGKSQPRGGP